MKGTDVNCMVEFTGTDVNSATEFTGTDTNSMTESIVWDKMVSTVGGEHR